MESKNLCPRLKPRSSTWTCSCDSYRALLPQVNPNCSCINYLLARIELMESYWPKLFEHVTNFFHFWTKWLFKGKTGANWSFIVLYNLDKLQKKMAGKFFPQKWYLCNLLGWLSLQRRYKYLQMWACLSLQMHNGVDGNKRNLSNMSTQLQAKKRNPKWWKSPSPFQYRSVNNALNNNQ